jgi:transcriptional regulator with XRE-family HTH domain
MQEIQLREKLGTLIEEYAQYYGVDQPKIAEQLEVHPLTVQRWFEGKHKPNVATCWRLAKLLHMNPPLLLTAYGFLHSSGVDKHKVIQTSIDTLQHFLDEEKNSVRRINNLKRSVS